MSIGLELDLTLEIFVCTSVLLNDFIFMKSEFIYQMEQLGYSVKPNNITCKGFSLFDLHP